MRCKRCGSIDIVLFKDTHRCSVCDSTNITGVNVSATSVIRSSGEKHERGRTKLGIVIGAFFSFLLAIVIMATSSKEPDNSVHFVGSTMVISSKGQDASIHIEVMRGNIEAVEQHLRAGVDVNAKAGATDIIMKKEKGYTPLMCACLSYIILADEVREEVIKLLIVNGADVNVRDKEDNTSLHHAMSKNSKFAEILINSGANINAKNNWGLTPLHQAAWDGYYDCVKLLISNEVDVNPITDRNETPIDCAKLNNETKIITLLRKHGGKTAEELKAEGK